MQSGVTRVEIVLVCLSLPLAKKKVHLTRSISFPLWPQSCHLAATLVGQAAITLFTCCTQVSSEGGEKVPPPPPPSFLRVRLRGGGGGEGGRRRK